MLFRSFSSKTVPPSVAAGDCARAAGAHTQSAASTNARAAKQIPVKLANSLSLLAGTVLGEALFAALRRLAQEDASARWLLDGGPEPARDQDRRSPSAGPSARPTSP